MASNEDSCPLTKSCIVCQGNVRQKFQNVVIYHHFLLHWLYKKNILKVYWFRSVVKFWNSRWRPVYIDVNWHYSISFDKDTAERKCSNLLSCYNSILMFNLFNTIGTLYRICTGIKCQKSRWRLIDNAANSKNHNIFVKQMVERNCTCNF